MPARSSQEAQCTTSWFSLEQTEWEDYSEPLESPQWHAEAALVALDITLDRFDCLDGNVLGYALPSRLITARELLRRASAESLADAPWTLASPGAVRDYLRLFLAEMSTRASSHAGSMPRTG